MANATEIKNGNAKCSKIGGSVVELDNFYCYCRRDLTLTSSSLIPTSDVASPVFPPRTYQTKYQKNSMLYRGFQACFRVFGVFFSGLFTGRVKPHGSGRVGLAEPTRPAIISRRLDPTRPDPRKFRDVLTRPDLTRETFKTS